jgi:peroxiredoxin-like protein
MHPFPHTYVASAAGGAAGSVTVESPGLSAIASAVPEEFDGPGDQWSPETLLVAAVADCFVLSFRAVAAASGFEWTSVTCASEGILDRVERVNRFTSITNTVTLRAPAGTSEDKARRLVEKADQVCLISNSLNAELHLEIRLELGT